MDLESLIDQLADSGVGFTAKHMGPGGEIVTEMSRSEVITYLLDSDAFWGARYGISAVDFRLWQDSNFSVQCAARTALGAPCKAIVTGGSLLANPKKWVEMQGQYCHSHELI